MTKVRYALGLFGALFFAGVANAQMGPDIHSVNVTGNQAGDVWKLQAGSYQQNFLFGSSLSVLEVPSHTRVLEFDVMTSGTNAHVGFAWVANSQNIYPTFDETTANLLSQKVTFYNASHLDFDMNSYGGQDKWVYLFVFVRNGDGVSVVPNMSVEVDDIMPILFHRASSSSDNNDDEDDDEDNNGNGRPIYEGKDGKTYTEKDFTGSKLKLVGLARDGRANFHWNQPPKRYDGFALYITEGNFRGGLDNYDPIYLSEDTFSYTYPTSTSVSSRTRVSAALYAFIELKDGTKKFIQPGKRASVIVRPGRPSPEPVCGDKSGGDATYTLCIGDVLMHNPSTSTITLKSQVGNMVSVEVKDVGMFNLNLDGSPLIVETKNGQVLQLRLSKGSSFQLMVSTVTNLKKGDKSGLADGSYQVFVGDSLAHASSSLSINTDWYLKSGSESVQISLMNVSGTSATGTSKETFTVGSPKTFTSNSGVQLKVTLVSISADYLLSFKLETVQPTPPPGNGNGTCEDQTGGDGVYTLCIGDTVRHEPSGITLEVLFYLRIGRFAHLELDGATKDSVYISYWMPVVVESDSGQKLRITYLPQTNSTHLKIRLTTVP